MPKKKAHLLELVGVLLAHSTAGEVARRRFNRAAEQLMDEYGLPADARQALLTMDATKIGDFVRQEIINWQFPEREFPEDDADCKLPGAAGQIAGLYPMPNPEVRQVDPVTVPANAQGQKFTVYGEGFVRHVDANGTTRPCAVRLVSTAGTFDFEDGVNAAVKMGGSFRCSHVEVTAQTPPAGTYDVHVVNRVGPNPNDTVVLTQKPVKLTVQ